MGVFKLNGELSPFVWLTERNRQIKNGSRVFVRLAQLFTQSASPACFRVNKQGGSRRIYNPVQNEDACVVQYLNGLNRVRYNLTRIHKEDTNFPQQRNAAITLSDEAMTDYLCLDNLHPADIDRILTFSTFATEQDFQIRELLQRARPYAAKEVRSNELALEFMLGLYMEIVDRVTLPTTPADYLARVLSDYRCAVHGREISESVLNHQDMRKKLQWLVSIHCCKHTQQQYLDKIRDWNQQNNKLFITHVGLSPLGQTSVYFQENGREWKALFSLNAHGKPVIGKIKPTDFYEKNDLYFINIL